MSIIALLSNLVLASAAGAATKAASFGGQGLDTSLGVVVRRDGSTVVAGTFEHEVTFGNITVSTGSAHRRGLFVLSRSRAGEVQWVRQFSNRGYDHEACAVAGSGADGSVVVAGMVRGALVLGNLTLPDLWNGDGTGDAFVARVSAAGAVVWARRFGNVVEHGASGVAVRADGSIAVVGAVTFTKFYMDTSTGWGLAGLSGGDPGRDLTVKPDALVLSLGPGGDLQWARAFGGEGADAGLAVATRTDGTVAVAGTFMGPAKFGNFTLDGSAPISATPTTAARAQSSNAFVLCLSKDGDVLWARALAGPSAVIPFGIAVREDKSVAVTGSFVGTVQWGGVGETLVASSARDSAFVWSLGAAQGEPQWARRLGSPQRAAGHAVAARADGSVVVSGTFYGNALGGPHASFGPVRLAVTGNSGFFQFNGFVLSLTAAGRVEWADQLGTGVAAYTAAHAIATRADGAVIVAGNFQGYDLVPTGVAAYPTATGGVDFGGARLGPSRKSLNDAPTYDAFVVELSAIGTGRCAPGFVLAATSDACAACEDGTFANPETAGRCNNCSAGSFPDADHASCTPCAAGTAAAGTGLTQCSPCAAGRYTNLTGQARCTECTAGASSDAVGAADAGTCEACPCGQFSGAGSARCSGRCPAGRYGATVGASAVCIDCPPGSQCRDGTRAACPAGFFQDEPRQSTCKGCHAKHFGNESNRTVGACSGLCPPGFFCPVSTKDPIACPSGTFCGTGAAIPAVQLPCFPGTFVADANDPSPARCQPCAAGFFQIEADKAQCTACPLGKFQARSGKTSCDACAAGKRGGAGASLPRTSVSSHCEACPAATFSTVAGAESCSACAGCGHSGAERSGCGGASGGVCIACSVGRSKAGLSAGSCEPCAARFFQNATGQAQCIACNSVTCPNGAHRKGCGGALAGYCGTCLPGTSISGSACDACAPGHFSATENVVACAPCSAQSFQPAAGKGFCFPHTVCAKGERVASRQTATADRVCVACHTGHFSNETNAASCGRCPRGKYQNAAGQPFCETYTEGFAYSTNNRTGLVEQRQCPAGKSCSGERTETCVNQISNTATGKCISCEDKFFANADTNECVACPLRANGTSVAAGGASSSSTNRPSSLVATGVRCESGAISVEPDFWVVGSREGPVALGPGMRVLRCRGRGVCGTTRVAGGMAVRTACTGNTTGGLCGACAAGTARLSQGASCEACSADSAGAALVLLGALLVFGVLYRQCIKFALKNARRGRKSPFMTFSVIKIATTFLFQTSLLSSWQLDWGALLTFLFQVNNAVASGDPTTMATPQCFGLDLHRKMQLLFAAPFVVLLLPLPMLLKARLGSGGQHHSRLAAAATVFGVPRRDAYPAAVLVGWWLLYPAVLSHCISSLLTLRVGGREYALADLSVETSHPDYVATRSLAVALLCTFVPALPLGIFGAMHRWRAALREEGQPAVPAYVRHRLFYFFGSYDSRRWYWEGVVFATRTGMVVLAALSATAVERQQQQQWLFVVTWLALLNFCLVFKYEPFSRAVESWLNKLTQGVLLALLLSALGLSMDVTGGRGAFAAVLRGMCASLVLLAIASILFVFVQQYGEKRRAAASSKRSTAAAAAAAHGSSSAPAGHASDPSPGREEEEGGSLAQHTAHGQAASQMVLRHNPMYASDAHLMQGERGGHIIEDAATL